MFKIFSFVKIKVRYIIAVVIFILATTLGEMLLPTLLSVMIDGGVKNNDKYTIFIAAAVMAGLVVISCICHIIASKISAKITTGFSADIRSAMFKKIQKFSSVEMDKFGTASLVTRSTSDVTIIQQFMTYLLSFGLMAPFMAFMGIVLASSTGGKIGTVLNVSIPVLLIACFVIIFLIIKYADKLRKKVDRINRLFLENLEGVRVIRAFNKQNHERERFKKENGEYTSISITSSKIIGTLSPVIEAIFGLTIAAIMLVGSVLVYEGEMEVGVLVANCQYISMILIAVIMFTLVVATFPNAHACAKRINEVLNTESSIVDGEKTTADKKLTGTVEFQDVTFTYPGASAPVLNNVTFSAKPGEFVAIIGRTGSGKSSLVKLIPRYYDVSHGKVLVNGINVKDYKLSELREMIGYVPQKNVLFTGDVASNLNFGNENGTDADWKYATDIACATDFIENKELGYHADIDQGGTNLSGGQRQRMAIARAVMKKPEIYIFDDSFSALDMKTDRNLRSNIRQNMSDATVIIVAQRISSIMDADRILVLEDNKVIGMGTHKELLKSCNLYREIAVLQLGEEAVKNEESRND